MPAGPGPSPRSVVQQGYDVSIDPFRPRDPKRTYMTFTGAAVVLTETGTTDPGFAIAVAGMG